MIVLHFQYVILLQSYYLKKQKLDICFKKHDDDDDSSLSHHNMVPEVSTT